MAYTDSLSVIVKASYSIFSILSLCIVSFHAYRMKQISHTQEKTNHSIKILRCVSLAYVSYIILLLPTFRFIVMTIWHWNPPLFTTIPCHIIAIFNTSIWFATQGFIHLFIAMRSQLNPTTIASHQNSNIWYNVGLILILSDFLFMFYTFAVGNTYKCQQSFIWMIGALWSSGVIGVYSLCVFIYPLRRYLKMEQNDALLRYLLLKIIVYTVIIITTTILSAAIFVIFRNPVTTELVPGVDNLINSYCIMLQFRDIDIKSIQSKYIQRIVSFLQCSCGCIRNHPIKVRKEVDLTDIVTMKTPEFSCSRAGSSQKTIGSETVPSNYNEDRRKYVETIIQGDIDNGVTGKYISLSVVETAYIFWKKYIQTTPQKQKTEVACSLYFEMMNMNDEMKRLLAASVAKKKCTIEEFACQLVANLDWIINNLLAHDIDLYETLQKLGIAHKNMGVEINHFGYLLSAVHLSFAHYFPNKYSIKEKYAMDKIFNVTSRIMYGRDINTMRGFIDFSESFDNLDFVQSLDLCLQSQVGCDYLHRYFEQTFCDEIVIWLQSVKLFKLAMSDKERFMIARRIKTDCIDPLAPFAINISHETRNKTLDTMKELESKWLTQRKTLTVSVQLFAQCEMQMVRLIQKNHWKKFVEMIHTFTNTSL